MRECIFKCRQPEDDTMIDVEMNIATDGTFHANQDHQNQAVRVSSFAHARCYSRWYEQTYKVPFTMSA